MKKLLAIAIVGFLTFCAYNNYGNHNTASGKYSDDPKAKPLTLVNKYFSPEHINAAQGIKAYAPSENFPNGLILLANGYVNSVAAFDLDFTPIFIFPYNDGHHKAGLMADVLKIDDNRLAYTSYRGDSILVYNKDGKLTETIGVAGNNSLALEAPIGMELLPSGNIIIADYGNHRLQLLDNKGGFIRMWGQKGNKPGDTEAAYDVCVYGEEIFLSDRTNSRFQVFTEQGELLRHFPLRNAEIPFKVNQHCDFDSKGNLYVVDTDHRRVVKLSRDGDFIESYTHSEFGSVRGLAIDHKDRIYVTGMPQREGEKYSETEAGVWVFEAVTE